MPLDKVVVQLNVDMIGRSRKAGEAAGTNTQLTGPNETYVIGSKMMSSALGSLSERVNKDYLDLSFNYKYDEPTDPNRFFFRSDHYNYAKKGVPIIFYFSGVHSDYHRVSDEIGAIDFAQAGTRRADDLRDRLRAGRTAGAPGGRSPAAGPARDRDVAGRRRALTRGAGRLSVPAAIRRARRAAAPARPA